MDRLRTALGELAVPLACYLGVTLVVPGLRGRARSLEFAVHAAVVVGLCLGVAVVLSSFRVAARTLRRHAVRAEENSPRPIQ